jgi:hypothetical protein
VFRTHRREFFNQEEKNIITETLDESAIRSALLFSDVKYSTDWEKPLTAVQARKCTETQV